MRHTKYQTSWLVDAITQKGRNGAKGFYEFKRLPKYKRAQNNKGREKKTRLKGEERTAKKKREEKMKMKF